MSSPEMPSEDADAYFRECESDDSDQEASYID